MPSPPGPAPAVSGPAASSACDPPRPPLHQSAQSVPWGGTPPGAAAIRVYRLTGGLRVGLDPEPASAPGVLEIRFEFKPGVLEKRFESKPGVLEVRSEFELSHEFEPASAPGRGPRLGFEFC